MGYRRATNNFPQTTTHKKFTEAIAVKLYFSEIYCAKNNTFKMSTEAKPTSTEEAVSAALYMHVASYTPDYRTNVEISTLRAQ